MIFCAITKLSLAQYKLKDIPFELREINKSDDKGKQGIWIFYDKVDSTVFAMQNFVNDSLNGYFERYWRNGKISEKGFYKNGQLDSLFIGYWENGKIRGEASYSNGALDGLVKSFNQNSELTSRLRYIKGVLDSGYTETYVDSSLDWDYLAKSKIDTVITNYNSDWNKKYAIYENDSLTKDISFYKDHVAIENFYHKGIIVKRLVYFKMKPYTIEKIFYYTDGKLSRTELFDKKGKKIRNN